MRLITKYLICGNKLSETASIPELLKQLILPAGCVIAIGAAGTYKENAAVIRELAAAIMPP
jgi:hypothetical protein